LALVGGLLDPLLHEHVAVGGAGDVAADEEDVLVGEDVEELEVLDGLPLVAHVAAHALALVDAAGREAAADRAAVAEGLVASVGAARAAQLVTLEHALVALALGAADDVDGATLLEDLGDLEHLADLVLGDLLGGEADLAHDARRLEVRLGVDGELRLRD